MKKSMLILPVIFLSIVAKSAIADYLQFVDSKNGIYIAYTAVIISGKNYYTDKYGRAKISIPNGKYTAQINYEGSIEQILFNIDGSNQLKTINVK